MAILWQVFIAFPTVVWTIPLGFLLLYWLMILVGALDIHMPGHVDVDTDADVGVDGHAGVEGHADADGDVHAGGLFHHLAQALALGTTPFVVVISSIIVFGWASCAALHLVIGPYVTTLAMSVLFSIAALGVTLVLAVWVTSLVARPLGRVFVLNVKHGQAHLIGKIVEITSSRVSADFGTAVYHSQEDLGSEILLNVITQHAEYPFRQGEEAVIVAYDAAQDVYAVAPLPTSPSQIAVDP